MHARSRTAEKKENSSRRHKEQEVGQHDHIEKLTKSIERLQSYIIKEDYRGYDPFDALTSPLCSLPLLSSSRIFKIALQQTVKRSPWDSRPFLGIAKGLNPVTLGLCVQAFSYLTKVFPKRAEFYMAEIGRCLDMLVQSRSKGFSGACWGYDFPWEARSMSLPAYYPTIVATGIITNSLFTCYRVTKIRKRLTSARIPSILS